VSRVQDALARQEGLHSVLSYKRLAQGRFRMPKIDTGADRVMLDGTELAMLLGGFDLAGARRTAAWQPHRRQRVA
jgi:transposase